MKIILKHTLSSIRKGFGQIVIMIITMIIITASIFVSLSVTDIFRKNADVWSQSYDIFSDLRIAATELDVDKLDIIVEENKEYIENCIYSSEIESTIKSSWDTTRIELLVTDEDKMLDMLDTPILSEIENTSEYPSLTVSRILSEKLEVNVGDVIDISSVHYGGFELKMFVSKIAENSTYLYTVGNYRAMVDYDELVTYLDTDKIPYNACRFYFYSPNALYPNDPEGRDVVSYIYEEIFHELDFANATSGAIYCNESLQNSDKSINETQNTLNVGIAVIVLMMIFILYFSYSIIAKNRTEIIIRFKAAGATPIQTVGIMLVEVVFYAIIACSIGVVVGKLLNDIIASSLLYSKSTLLTYEPWKYILSLFAGVATGVFSCLVPAYKISRKSIRQLMTGDMLISKRLPFYVPIIFSILLAVCFILLFTLPEYALYSMIALVLVGCFWVVTVTPYILKLFSLIMSKITTRKEGKLATLGLHRNSGIATVTAMMSLMIAFIWAGISIIGVISTVTKEENSRYTSNFTIRNIDGGTYDSMQEELTYLNSLDGLDHGVAYKKDYGMLSTITESDETRLENGASYYAISSGDGIKYFTKDWDEDLVTRFNNTTRPIIISYKISQHLEVEIGDTIKVDCWYTNDLKRVDGDFTVVGIDHYYTVFDDQCIFKLEDLKSGETNFEQLAMLYAFSGDDTKFTTLREEIDNRTRILYRTNSYYLTTEESDDIFLVLDYVSYFFYFVSAIGLINLITITSIERKKEMETFRLVGLTTGGSFKMTFVEGIIISIAGFIMGLVMAIAISNLQPIFCNIMGSYAVFDIFPARMFIIAIVGSVIGLLMWMASPLLATTMLSHKDKINIHSSE